MAGAGGARPGALQAADVVLGAPRQLALLPALSASHATWPSPLMPALPGLLAEHAGRALVVLASGDPTFYGIGSAVLAHDPTASVHPAPSSLALACARLGWAAQDVEVLSTVGRPPEAVRAALAPRGVCSCSCRTATPRRRWPSRSRRGATAPRR